MLPLNLEVESHLLVMIYIHGEEDCQGQILIGFVTVNRLLAEAWQFESQLFL